MSFFSLFSLSLFLSKIKRKEKNYSPRDSTNILPSGSIACLLMARRVPTPATPPLPSDQLNFFEGRFKNDGERFSMRE